ncbi:hypothetical protein GQ457_02G035740 [Hibiscus cannabinus]
MRNNGRGNSTAVVQTQRRLGPIKPVSYNRQLYPLLHQPSSSEKGDDCPFMACIELDSPDHEGAGRKTFHQRRTDLPDRGLQIFDPFLSYPSTVLVRERAIVINLEHIKTIIMAQEVLMLNFKNPSDTPFVNELQRKIQSEILSFLFHSSILLSYFCLEVNLETFNLGFTC